MTGGLSYDPFSRRGAGATDEGEERDMMLQLTEADWNSEITKDTTIYLYLALIITGWVTFLLAIIYPSIGNFIPDNILWFIFAFTFTFSLYPPVILNSRLFRLPGAIWNYYQKGCRS